MEQLLFNWYRVSVWNGEQILETDGVNLINAPYTLYKVLFLKKYEGLVRNKFNKRFVQILYTENHKAMLREMKEGIHKWRDRCTVFIGQNICC